MQIVEPPRVGYARNLAHQGLLLPIEPPEVHALFFERMQNQVEVIRRPLLVCGIEGNVFLRRRIDAHGARHRRIRSLPRLNARRGMQIHRGLQAVLVKALQEGIGIGKQHPVPCVAGPAQHLARLVHRAHGFQLLVAQVPVHVDHKHIERRIVLAESAHQFVQLLVAISPIARPPDAEGKARRQRDAAGDFDVVAKRLLVVVAVAEEVPIRVRAGLFPRRTLHHPRPGALLAVQKAKVGRVEEWTRRVVHQRPSRA